MADKRRFFKFALLASVIFGVYQNCSKTSFGTSQASLQAMAGLNTGPAPSPAPVDTSTRICDPLGGNAGNQNQRQGLVGDLYYVPSFKNPTVQLISDGNAFLANAVKAPGTIYMSQMNVTTRNFSEGFKTGSGAYLTDPTSGQPLTEYFGLMLRSTVALTGADAEGYYQFATISDDGATLSTGAQILAGGNQPDHSTQTSCGRVVMYLTRNQGLPINYFYFQSQKTELASVIAWRRVPANQVPDQVGCDPNGYWPFGDTGPNGWAAMQNVGWKVIPTANYQLPSDAANNTCP